MSNLDLDSQWENWKLFGHTYIYIYIYIYTYTYVYVSGFGKVVHKPGSRDIYVWSICLRKFELLARLLEKREKAEALLAIQRGSSLKQGPFWIPQIVRHPFSKDLKVTLV